jgi:shikimate kinase
MGEMTYTHITASRERCDPAVRHKMKNETDNLVLIGMPGAGKSTVGVILAKRTMRAFVDTDVLIQTSRGRTLQDIVDADGYLVLRKIEEEVLRGLQVRRHVIATGGSAVYSEVAMAHLRSNGIAIFLDADLPTITSRIKDFGTRGLAKRPDQDLADLFRERVELYRKYADIIIPCGDRDQEEVCASIIEELGRTNSRRSPRG